MCLRLAGPWRACRAGCRHRCSHPQPATWPAWKHPQRCDTSCRCWPCRCVSVVSSLSPWCRCPFLLPRPGNRAPERGRAPGGCCAGPWRQAELWGRGPAVRQVSSAPASMASPRGACSRPSVAPRRCCPTAHAACGAIDRPPPAPFAFCSVCASENLCLPLRQLCRALARPLTAAADEHVVDVPGLDRGALLQRLLAMLSRQQNCTSLIGEFGWERGQHACVWAASGSGGVWRERSPAFQSSWIELHPTLRARIPSSKLLGWLLPLGGCWPRLACSSAAVRLEVNRGVAGQPRLPLHTCAGVATMWWGMLPARQALPFALQSRTVYCR